MDAYFAPGFVFHGPDGAELDYEGLKGYFGSLRAAFDDLTIDRGVIVVDGAYVACQTTIAGTFVTGLIFGRIRFRWAALRRPRCSRNGAAAPATTTISFPGAPPS